MLIHLASSALLALLALTTTTTAIPLSTSPTFTLRVNITTPAKLPLPLDPQNRPVSNIAGIAAVDFGPLCAWPFPHRPTCKIATVPSKYYQTLAGQGRSAFYEVFEDTFPQFNEPQGLDFGNNTQDGTGTVVNFHAGEGAHGVAVAMGEDDDKVAFLQLASLFCPWWGGPPGAAPAPWVGHPGPVCDPPQSQFLVCPGGYPDGPLLEVRVNRRSFDRNVPEECAAAKLLPFCVEDGEGDRREGQVDVACYAG